jgi:hypothetical protein
MDAVMVRRNGTARNASVSGEEWREALPGWLSYLVAAFPQARVDMMTYAVLEDVFQEVPGEVMKAAARAYVRQHAFWPTAAELRPYVEWAERQAVQQLSPAEAHELRMAQLRESIRYSDEEMMAWEVARGTMVVEA